jgi:hypothetical protein
LPASRHRVQNVQPGRVLDIFFKVRGDVDDVGVQVVALQTELPDHLLIVRLRHKGM